MRLSTALGNASTRLTSEANAWIGENARINQKLSGDKDVTVTADSWVETINATGLPSINITQLLLGRKKKHTPGVYSMAGGAICPRCTFPYSRNMLSPNLVIGKLARCPHCGKWAIVSRASAKALQAAEARFAAESQGTIETISEEEKIRQMIDDSRFEE